MSLNIEEFKRGVSSVEKQADLTMVPALMNRVRNTVGNTIGGAVNGVGGVVNEARQVAQNWGKFYSEFRDPSAALDKRQKQVEGVAGNAAVGEVKNQVSGFLKNPLVIGGGLLAGGLLLKNLFSGQNNQAAPTPTPQAAPAPQMRTPNFSRYAFNKPPITG